MLICNKIKKQFRLKKNIIRGIFIFRLLTSPASSISGRRVVAAAKIVYALERLTNSYQKILQQTHLCGHTCHNRSFFRFKNTEPRKKRT